MGDPRLNGIHLNVARRDQYDATVDEMLDDRGSVTSEADQLVRLPSVFRTFMRREVPPDGTYTLVSVTDGKRHPLRVGINTVGRFPENDLVLQQKCMSRRHCIILVHASGGCEVYDTASRHGIWVNHSRVARVHLFPGDVLKLCDQKFMVAWVGPEGELFESTAGSETDCLGGLSPTE